MAHITKWLSHRTCSSEELLDTLIQKVGLEGVIELFARRVAARAQADPYHLLFQRFVEETRRQRPCRLLEIGSRWLSNSDGERRRQQFASCEEYVGLDIHPGPGVDIVGDIHQLSSCVAPGRFTAVYSISVFEHLVMPWKAVIEINKVLTTGGLLMIQTHPTWPRHELPWDFWRYQQSAFKGLLNQFTGFEILDCTEGLPCRILPLGAESSMRGLIHAPANLGVAVLAKKVAEVSDRVRWDVETGEITSDMYPEEQPPAGANSSRGVTAVADGGPPSQAQKS